jgi:O-antigen biosynthesis protein
VGHVLCDSPGARSLLDVGCGMGAGFAGLRQRGLRVVGIDHDVRVVEAACELLDDAMLLDVEAAKWPPEFTHAFDVVAFADCLEHLRDPSRVVRSVRQLLTASGVVVAGVPNVRQIRVVVNLALGRWTYVDGPAIMSNSHLRFFTERTVRDLFHIAGYTDIRCLYPRQTFHLRQSGH